MDLQTAFDRGFEAVKVYVEAELGAFATRIAALEEQPMSADLGEQLKAATRLLAELPPPSVVPSIPEAVLCEAVSRHLTATVITRAGELAVSYSDGTSERLGHVIGPQGEKGLQGERGADGIGIRGDVGPPGRDGVSVTAASINRDGELMLTLSDGSVLTPGRVVAAKRA